MKKAKVILTIVVLFALIGGALAFKARKPMFTNTLFFVYTDVYTYTNGVEYFLPGSYCIRPSIHFVTVSGGVISAGYYTSVPVYRGTVTGTAGGGATLSVIYYSCLTLPFTTTRVTTNS